MMIIRQADVDLANGIRKAREEGRQIILLRRRNCGRDYLENLVQTEDIDHDEIRNPLATTKGLTDACRCKTL